MTILCHNTHCFYTDQVCTIYPSGFRATAVACVGGVNAKAKAEKTAEEILKRQAQSVFCTLTIMVFHECI